VPCVPAARLVSRSSGPGAIERGVESRREKIAAPNRRRQGPSEPLIFRGAHEPMNIMPPELSGSRPTAEHLACLGLGSNVDPGRHLRRAIRRLESAVAVEAVSTAWESPAVGSDGPDYVNAALLVRTALSKEALLARLKQIEDELGRLRTRGRPVARLTIDIDVVVFDREVLEDDLWSQAYRAVPVAELLPDLRCPATGEALSHAATRLAAALDIKPRPEILKGSRPTGMSRSGAADSTRTRTP
jgi:2-amino-4-hydroxy-6-hydroxymethyldihydropteridine diphosphokinase